MGTCLECEEHIDLDEGVEVGHIIECPACKARLEVLDLHPVSFDYAPDAKLQHD
jgi:lysine biosynthesis protein LysW